MPSNAYPGANPQLLIHNLLRSIRTALGRSLWALYRQLMRNILRNWDGSSIGILSSRSLVLLLKPHLKASFRHNDLARAIRAVHGARIPFIEIKFGVPDDIKMDYWRFSEDAFGKGVCGLAKWEMLVHAGEKVAQSQLRKGKDTGLNSPFVPFFDGVEILGEVAKDQKLPKSKKKKKVEIPGNLGIGDALVDDLEARMFALKLRDFLMGTKETDDPISDKVINPFLWEFRGPLAVYDAHHPKRLTPF